MIVAEKRINGIFGIQIVENEFISSDCVSYWLTPFFSIYADSATVYKLIGKIQVVANIEKEYIYENNTFYVSGKMKKNDLYYSIMSIVRALFKYIALLFSYGNLHAACLDYKGKGILIDAERNQGKTTLLLRAMQTKLFSVVANDQVMYESNRNIVLGYPAAVGIRDNGCDCEELNIIRKHAIRFIEDPFQERPKPIIHIKDLAKIYRCNLTKQTELHVLINYKKSSYANELQFKKSNFGRIIIQDLSLPLLNTYKSDLLDACMNSILYHVNMCHAPKAEKIRFGVGMQVEVRCGLARIDDMLQEIRGILD